MYNFSRIIYIYIYIYPIGISQYNIDYLTPLLLSSITVSNKYLLGNVLMNIAKSL